jgi:hypothetical protein
LLPYTYNIAEPRAKPLALCHAWRLRRQNELNPEEEDKDDSEH